MYQEFFNKLKPLTVSNRLCELSERYIRTGLSNSVPLVLRLLEEYKAGFESRYIEYPTPLSFFVFIKRFKSILILLKKATSRAPSAMDTETDDDDEND
ncbi:hypothetical protein BpHYR1_044842 [Brachionus plicatilis]|uniref:Uncharacterized protein n=1 Tax=Brachionus plicatilis TaxID=10195 RepID=A0A3M7RAS7_BRAPC|nr:hypothetical protein BpHYR1_044842 [Brachionus plicatilis]